MRRSIFQAATAAAAALVLTAWASSARADDTSPEGTRAVPITTMEPTQTVVMSPSRDVITTEEKTPNFGLITSGALMLGIPYAVSVMVAGTSDRSADSRLYIPVVGPWVDLGERGGEVGPRRGGDTTNKVLLVADGIFQGLGMLQIIGGFVFPTTKVVTRTATVQVAPAVGSSLVGVGAVGRF